VTDAGIRGLELIPTLEDLDLAGTQLTDVSCLRDSRGLKKLNLWSTGVTDAGIRGLELIPPGGSQPRGLWSAASN
jgi:hypothetical protein